METNVEFEADPTTPSRGRAWLADRMGRGIPLGLRQRALIVASELLSNAVTHGVGPISLGVSVRATEVAICVEDRGGPAEIELDAPMPPPEARHGRGLPVVRALASDLTAASRPGRTMVFARVARDRRSRSPATPGLCA